MTEPTTRPVDVDTGFWLWVTAVPLLAIGYLIDNVLAPAGGPSVFVRGMAVVMLVIVAAIVVTFLVLMRQGYRWTRTLLSASGFGTIAYTVTNLFTVDREPAAAALGYAATAISTDPMIAGGLFLLHRKDADAFFAR